MLQVIDHAPAASRAEFKQAATWLCRRNIKMATPRRDRIDRSRRAINGVKNALIELFAEADVPLDDHTARKLTYPGYVDPFARPQPMSVGEREEFDRFRGWLRTARHLPCLKRLITYRPHESRTGLTVTPNIDPYEVFRIWPSPHAADKWIRRVMKRAQQILGCWDTHPSYRMVARYLQLRHKACRVHVAAKCVAAMTLWYRYGACGILDEDSWFGDVLTCRRGAIQFLAGMRIVDPQSGHRPSPPPYYNADGDMWDLGKSARTILDWYGEEGDDDRVIPMRFAVVCACEAGAVIVGDAQRDRQRLIQVVVTDPCQGTRCHLTVPPFFGLPLRSGETAAQRVHAAVAWTFGMTPAEYRPAVET